MTLVVATTNPGKIREITAILQGAPVDLRTPTCGRRSHRWMRSRR